MLRKSAELLTFICENKIHSAAELEDMVNAAADKVDNVYGVEIDKTKAVKWYKAAAGQENEKVQNSITTNRRSCIRSAVLHCNMIIFSTLRERKAAA